MIKNSIPLIFFALLFLGVLLLTFFLFQPYLGALFVAMVLAVMFGPVYRYFETKLSPYRGIAAAITVAIVLFVILLPLSYISAMLFQEAKDLSLTVVNNGTGSSFLADRLESVERSILTITPDAELDLDPKQYIQNVVLWLTDNLGSFFSGFASITLKTFLMIIALFFFLRDGKKLKQTVVEWSPLADNYDEGLLNKLGVAVNSVIKGDILIAVIQGLLAGIGFVIFGVPSPVLWGSVATITALIPTVGTGIVIFPAVIYLYFASTLPMAVGLLIWGVVIVGLIDNYLRPTLIHKDINIHPFIILLSVFGGLSLFGPLGFLAGPIIVSFLFALIDVLPEIVQAKTYDSTEPVE